MINSLLNNKDGKTLLSNFFYLSLLQVAGYVFPIFTYPYLADVIGAKGFGEIAFGLAVVMWFQTVTDWGFNYTATRDLAKNRDKQEKVSEIFSNVFWAKMFLMVCSVVILKILCIVVPIFCEHEKIIWLTFLLIPGYILFPQWLFQGLERMKYITLLNVLAKLLFTLATFFIIKEKEDYIYQPVLVALGYFISGFLSFYLIVVRWKIKLQKPNSFNIYICLKGSFNVFINQLFPNLYNSLSVILLGHYGGANATGIFDAGSKLANVITKMFSIISQVFFPYLSRKVNNHNIYARMCIFFAVIFCLFLFVFSDYLVEIMFSREFSESSVVFRIMIISVFFLIVSDVYGTNFLIVLGYDKLLRNITIIVSILGFILSLALVKCYSYVGVALTILVVRFLLGFFTFIYSKKIKYDLRNS